MATSVESDTGPEVKNDPSTNTSGGSDSALEKNMDEARKPRIMYRVEWRYGDGEIAHEKEGHDEANLFIGHPTPESLPPLTITTVFHSSTTKERSKKMKKKKKKKKPDDGKHEQGKDTTVNQSETSNEEEEGANLEDFADSRASIKRMTIHSKKLINVLRDIVTYYPGLPLLGDGIYFYEPYQMLCHYMKDLRHYRDNQPPWHDEKYRKDCNQHLDILLEFLDDRYGRALQEEEARWARPTPVCHPYITREVRLHSSRIGNKVVKHEIDSWNIDFDGYQVGWCENYTWILPFDGEKEIRSLKYYPTKFHKDSQESIEKNDGKTFYQTLVARGRKFWDLAKKGNCYQEYSGESAERPHKKLRGRMVIDPLAYFGRFAFEYSDRGTKQDGPLIEDPDEEQEAGDSNATGCQCPSCAANPSQVRHDRFQGFHSLYPDEDEPPKDELFFFLCAQRVFAFILKSRTWETVYVKNLVDVTESVNAFHHLVLPEDVKYTLKAISCSYVKAQAMSHAHNPDIVKGEGEGKIFLLHGPPGTGKTLSAEVVAELTKRPLLSLTCGDLGTTAEEVELRLGRYMSLGEIWGAVVLLDEADVYLEARAINEVKRNTLVSVFLRALEYYKGLLFLTTNRVSTFDEAFKSRIHVALEYKRLTDEYRRLIWKTNMDKMVSDRIKVTETAREHVYADKDVLGLEWNGREIRNALQTAMSLAEFEAEDKGKDIVKIKSTHLRRIVTLSASFQRYIMSMHRNKSDSYVAKQKKLRNDYYEDDPFRGSGKNTIGKSKDLIPEVDEEAPRTKTRARDPRGTEDEELEDRKLRHRNGKVKQNSRAIFEDDEDVRRPRSKQPIQSSRHIAPIENDTEEEAPKLKKSIRRGQRLEEEESEDTGVPIRRKPARKPAREASVVRDEEEEEPPKSTRLARKPAKAVPVHEEEEEEEELLPRTTRPTKRSTMTFEDDERYISRESRSPTKIKKGIARKVTKVNESEEE